MSETTPETTDLRERVGQAVYDRLVDHPVWISDDGEPLDYLPEREARLADFIAEVSADLLPVVAQEIAAAEQRGREERDQALDLLSQRTSEKWQAEDQRDALRARVEALAVEWTEATCQTDGAPCSWHRVSAECGDDLRAALAEPAAEKQSIEDLRVALTSPTPPPEAAECCASGRCEVCTPGYVWGRDA